MSRPNPKDPPAVGKNEKPGWETQIRKYSIITPLYGGGEATQKADSVTVVRASEVRGHLRFWWRATRGGKSGGNLKTMKDEEEKIWGSPGEKEKAGPSRVIVQVTVPEKTKGTPIFAKDVFSKRQGKNIPTGIGEPQSPWGYVAFPLRVEKDQNGRVTKPAGSVLKDVEFELKISFPTDISSEVEAALWAWETFGGIGARTRRGFGALQNKNLEAPAMEKIQEKISAGLDQHVVDGIWPKGVPHLKRDLNFLVKPQKDCLSAWEYLFQRLKAFRQEFRYPGSISRFGRSKWPEPDSIRLILNKAGVYTIGRSQTGTSSQGKIPAGQIWSANSF